jgi:hypothetical protein
MIYDKGKIFAGLAIFAGLVASPFWYNPVFGTGSSAPPQVPLPKDGSKCVLPRAEMRASHMQVIYEWRETVVRGGGRKTRLADGREVEMSLSNTCLGCHEGQKKFCTACHEYLAVQPFCWDCHFDPKEHV